MNKARDWNVNLYQDAHNFVFKYGEDLLDLLAINPGEKILDLGCGTGQLTQEIALRHGKVIGIDNSVAMLEKAKNNYPELEFILADGKNFSFEKPFDAIFSNAALHWIKEAEATVNCIWRNLKSGGRFVAEFGGKGNVAEIINVLNLVGKKYGYFANNEPLNFWYFPSIGEYTSLLEQQGFDVTYAVLFFRPTVLNNGEEGLKNWLEMFANNLLFLIDIQDKEKILGEIETGLRNKLYRNGSWFADYRRLRVVAEKK